MPLVVTRGLRTLSMMLAIVVAFSLASTPSVVANHEYEQPVWFNWNTTELDVIVVGVDDPVILAAILDAIESWETGIHDLAPPWLADSFTLNVYVPARDGPAPPSSFLADIAVAPQGFMAVHWPVFGFVNAPTCHALAPMAIGWGSYYHVALHEFGHCLGLGHVFNHGSEYSPAFDPMGSGQSGFRSCPSNLNMAVLERVYSGQGGTVTMSASDYEQSDC